MPGRYEPQHGLLAVDDERVPGVVPALEPHDALRVLGQPIDDLAFAFIAPLGTDDDDVLAHAWLPGCGGSVSVSGDMHFVLRTPISHRAADPASTRAG